MVRYLFALFLLVLMIHHPLAAQLQSRFQVQHYSTENGLPSNGIKGLALDEQTGFLWIGTEAGVVRFNGRDFTVFSKGNLQGFTSERTLFLIQNHKGEIFFSDQNDQVFKVRSNLPAPYDAEHADLGALYSRRLSLAINQPTLASHVRYPKDPGNPYAFTKIASNNDTTAILLRQNKEICYITASSNTVHPIPLPGINIRDLFEIKGRCFIISDDRQFFELIPATGKAIPISSTKREEVFMATDDHSTRLYWESGMDAPLLIAGKNAWRLTIDHQTIVPELICDQVPENSFITFAQYSLTKGLLFLGTDSKGIIILQRKTVLPMKNRDRVITERNSYYAQVALDNGNILTNQGHVIGTNPIAPSFVPIAGMFNNTVFLQGDSLLYFGQAIKALSRNILHVYNYRTRRKIDFPKIRLNETTAAIYSNGKLYFASSEGLGVLNADSIQYIFQTPLDKQNGSWPTDMAEVQPGIFLTASCNGLIQYNINTKSRDTILYLPGTCIRTINKVRDYYFIGTYGKGFYSYRKGQLKKMPLDKNNFLLYTHCIIPDEAGFCWMSTNRGLFKVKTDDLVAAAAQDRQSIYYHYFGKNDGMDITEMNGGCLPCALQLKNKVISFPTMDGLLWVDPLTANPLLPSGKIYIDAVYANEKKLDSSAVSFAEELPANTSSITVKLGFSAWCNSENLYIDYRLTEQEAWKPINLDDEPVLKLNNLRPGKYVLHIRKLNGFGLDNYSYSALPFTVSVPWFSKWWFYALVLAAIFAAIRFYTIFRTNQYVVKQARLEKLVAEKTQILQQKNAILEKNNQTNMRLISIISHDIITPLKFMTVGGKELMNNKARMPEELQEETIAEITNTAQEIQLLSTNIMNWIKYQDDHRKLQKENFNLHDLANQVKGILDSIARQKNIRILNEVKADLDIYQFIEPIKILMNNLLTNAINFSVSGDIVIDCEAGAHEAPGGSGIWLRVRDQGVGMTPDQIQNVLSDEIIISSANIDNRRGNGLGYLIIKDLLKMIGGSIKIDSEKGKGTCVSVWIPA